MPTPPKTSDAAILDAARVVLERAGNDGFGLDEVARAVGVKTPSLYKRITDRASLLATLEQRGYEELGALMRLHCDDENSLTAMARAYRGFARQSPQLYARMLAPDAVATSESRRWRQDAVAPVIEAVTRLVGAANALTAARTVTAFLHGFVSMEAAGAFRLGGDIEHDFERALRAVLSGLTTLT